MTSPTLDAEAMRAFRQRVQMVFQDPYSSLNPRLSAEEIVTEPIARTSSASTPATRRERAAALLARVGLRSDVLARMPFEFSGGQRQRLGIARALSPAPGADHRRRAGVRAGCLGAGAGVEPDADLQEEFGLAYLFISHDLGVVEHIGHRIAVMYLGSDRRTGGQRDALFAAPQHPYSEALIAAAPVPDPRARKTAADHRGRGAKPDESADRLRVPSALSVCGGALQGGDAGAAADGGRQAGGVPSALSRPAIGAAAQSLRWCPAGRRPRADRKARRR